MKQIRCMIIDDEELAIKVLKSYIERIPFLVLKASTTSPFEAIEILKNKEIDLVFLDIEMPDLTGVELINSLSYQPAFIFVTAYRKYAADAFELDSVDYLVKPVSFSRFLRAVNKYRTYNQVHQTENDPTIYLKADRKTYKVNIKSILYIEGLKDYVKMYLEGGEMIIVKETMISLIEKLHSYYFIRCHKSFIVSLTRIKAFSSEFVEIENRKIPIGRSYREEVLEQLSS